MATFGHDGSTPAPRHRSISGAWQHKQQLYDDLRNLTVEHHAGIYPAQNRGAQRLPLEHDILLPAVV